MSHQQKIAFLCHPYHRGGVTRWMADAALAYDKQGLQVYFITIDPEMAFHSGKGRETLLHLLGKEKNNIQFITAKAGYEFEFGTPEYQAFIYQQLITQLSAGTPIILSNDEVVWAAATFVHTTYPIIGVLHADEEYYYGLANKYYKQVHALVCVSLRVQTKVLEKNRAIPRVLTSTIPCGIALPAAMPAAHAGDLLQLVYAGRLSDYQKRSGDLVKIAARLAADGVAFHLNIIGDGDAKHAMEAQVKTEGLQDAISFLGWRSQTEVTSYLAASDVLVLTSDFEGMPIAMMEALAVGCGIAGTRVSGIEDYEVHPLARDCFSIFPVGNIPVAVNNIKQLAGIPVSTRRAAARQLAEAEFDMEVCLQRYLHVIARIKHTAAPLPDIKLAASKIMYSRALAMARNIKVGSKK